MTVSNAVNSAAGQGLQKQGALSSVPDEQRALHGEDSGEQRLAGTDWGGVDRAAQGPGKSGLTWLCCAMNGCSN